MHPAGQPDPAQSAEGAGVHPRGKIHTIHLPRFPHRPGEFDQARAGAEPDLQDTLPFSRPQGSETRTPERPFRPTGQQVIDPAETIVMCPRSHF